MEEAPKVKVDLRTLKPNPTRDLLVDPIDKARIDTLCTSIKDNGFWGGVVIGRLKDKSFVILAGHSRVAAALKCGLTHADLFVAENLTPQRMLKIYGVENATQRGTDSSAIVGTVAGAIRIIANGLLGSGEIPGTSNKHLAATALGNLTSNKGLGHELVSKFLAGVPGMTENVVKQQIANLKASGDYARIVREVGEEIVSEREAAEQAAEKARGESQRKKAEAEAEEKRKAEEAAKKAAAAADKPVTFDLRGVQKHLRNADHVEKFRKVVTGQLLGPLLTVDKQASLAKKVVETAREMGAELTSKFIEEEAINLALKFKSFIRDQDRKTVKAGGIAKQVKKLQHHFSRNIAGALADATKLVEIKRGHAGEMQFLPEFLDSLGHIQKIAQKLDGFAPDDGKRLRLVHAKG